MLRMLYRSGPTTLFDVPDRKPLFAGRPPRTSKRARRILRYWGTEEQDKIIDDIEITFLIQLETIWFIAGTLGDTDSS